MLMPKIETIKVIQYKNPGNKWEDINEYHLSDYERNVVSLNRSAQEDLKKHRINDSDGYYRLINRRVKL